jgi:exosortase/archaeosortase family protein
VVLMLVAWVPAIEAWAVRHTIASLAGLAALLHIGFGATGTTLRLAGTTIEIVPDCTPLMPTAALWIAILAFPSPWPRRLLGLAAGAAALWLYNLARILALVPVLRFRPRWFDFIHIYLWQTMTLLVVFAIFLVWLGVPFRASGPRGARAEAARRSPEPPAGPRA